MELNSIRPATDSAIDALLSSNEVNELAPSVYGNLEPLGSAQINPSLERMLRDMYLVLGELAQGSLVTAQLQADSKKTVLDNMLSSKIADLNEREEQILKQQAAESKKKKSGILGKIFGIIAGLALAVFTGGASLVIAVAAVTVVTVLPMIVNKVLEAAGVDEKTRAWVSVGLEIGLSIIAMLLTFNPSGVTKAATKVGSLAAKSAKLAAQSSQTIARTMSRVTAKAVKASSKLAGKASKSGLKKTSGYISKGSSVIASASDITSTVYDMKIATNNKNSNSAIADLEAEQSALAAILKLIESTIERLLNQSVDILSTSRNSIDQVRKRLSYVNL